MSKITKRKFCGNCHKKINWKNLCYECHPSLCRCNNNLAIHYNSKMKNIDNYFDIEEKRLGFSGALYAKLSFDNLITIEISKGKTNSCAQPFLKTYGLTVYVSEGRFHHFYIYEDNLVFGKFENILKNLNKKKPTLFEFLNIFPNQILIQKFLIDVMIHLYETGIHKGKQEKIQQIKSILEIDE